jgi:NADH-quinone oxidoreductase subunit M
MILTVVWLLPALGALALAFVPTMQARMVAALFALAALVLTLVVAVGFDPAHHGYQFEQNVSWIPQFGVSYHLGVDGVSLWLLVLNALLTVIAVFATDRRMPRMRGFLSMLLLLEGAMAGLFLAADLLLFYVFWEGMLIPAYFLIWLWAESGDGRRAAIKFILYTLVGSLLALVGVIGEYIYTGARSFDLTFLATHHPSPGIQFGLFFLLGLAFAIKVPLFPFHGWLPDAYGVSPTAFLVTFAGVMGKTGAYAMLRILIPLLPQPQAWWDWNAVMPVLAVLGIFWGALMALAQRDLKQVVAYSSVSHMGFIVLGIFSLNQQGQQGAVVQMLNHGIIIPALFLLVAWVAARTGTRDRSVLKDLAPRMPVLTGVFLIVTLAALGLPGLNSFVGEFMTLLGAWQLQPWLAVAACVGLILAPIYMLRMFQGVMYAAPGEQLAGPLHEAGRNQVAARADITGSELAIIVPLVLLMIFLGLYPYVVTHPMPALGIPYPVPWR